LPLAIHPSKRRTEKPVAAGNYLTQESGRRTLLPQAALPSKRRTEEPVAADDQPTQGSGKRIIYPDCRPEFITAFDKMQRLATEGFADPQLRLEAPFMHMGKHQIVQLGAALQVSYADTWSCYKGEEKHCGTCGTCFERKEAFELAGVADPIEYEDTGD
jgi:7-cyano-7-deazaguanine synthase in queuosine biosynthesis